MCADDVNFTELNLEIARFNRLVQSRMTLQRCIHRLCKSTPKVYLEVLNFTSLLLFPSQAAIEVF